MRRFDLDHLLRAAGNVTEHKRFVLVGSNAIFAWYDRVPDRMALSREADLFADDVAPEQAAHLSDLLENIGPLSQFDETNGYYADGVGAETITLPADWRDRSKVYESPATDGVIAIVPHPNDIAISKLAAGRPKDLDWVGAAHRFGLIDLVQVERTVGRMDQIAEADRARLLELTVIVRRREGR